MAPVNAFHPLDRAQGSLIARLPAEEVAAAARKALDGMTRTKNPIGLANLARVLGTLAARLSPEEAGELSAPAVRTLLDTFEKTTYPTGRAALAEGIGSLASHLAPGEAAAAVRRLRGPLTRTTNPSELAALVPTVASLAARLPPGDTAARAAAAHKTLDALAVTTGPFLREQCFSGLSVLLPGLTLQELVELLKEPACVGEARSAVLHELGRRLGPPAPQAGATLAAGLAAPYPSAVNAVLVLAHAESRYAGGRRPFADLWEAVDWCREHEPRLDLIGPLR
jgi:hypothetical protein